MKKNSGGVDRVLRLAIGAALITWALVLEGPIWAWVGVIPLLTGIMGYCPIYSVLGFSTCPLEKK